MKKMTNKLYLVLGILLGITISATGVYAATMILSKDVSYDNTSSGLSATNLQDALDETYEKTNKIISSIPSPTNSNIVAVYRYDSSTCVTGEESTCKISLCYESTTSGSCPAGTIIKYKVNDSTTKYFHVLHDDGDTITMQQRENTINNTMWISAADYVTENTDSTSCEYTSCNDEGPMTALVALEKATSTWTNVNDQIYTMGTTNFNGTNAYTGCSPEYADNSCTTNTYTLDQRTGKSRMITKQEAASIGCTESTKSCPNWMNNYLHGSTNYGGTVDDIGRGSNYGYWTMSAKSSNTNNAWYVYYGGNLKCVGTYGADNGSRAVVVINK